MESGKEEIKLDIEELKEISEKLAKWVKNKN